MMKEIYGFLFLPYLFPLVKIMSNTHSDFLELLSKVLFFTELQAKAESKSFLFQPEWVFAVNHLNYVSIYYFSRTFSSQHFKIKVSELAQCEFIHLIVLFGCFLGLSFFWSPFQRGKLNYAQCKFAFSKKPKQNLASFQMACEHTSKSRVSGMALERKVKMNCLRYGKYQSEN